MSDVNLTGDLMVGLVSISGMDTSINAIASKLKLQNEVGAGDIEAFGGKIVMTANGDVQVEGKITAKKFEIDTSKEDEAALGSATLSKGETQVVVKTKAVGQNSKIFISTPPVEKIIGIIDKKEEESFTVGVTESFDRDIKFDWFIIDEKK